MAGAQLDRSAPVADAASLAPLGDGPEVGESQRPRPATFLLEPLSEMPRPSNESRRIYEGLRLTDPNGSTLEIARPNSGFHIWQQAQSGTWIPDGGIWLQPPDSERADVAGPRGGIHIMMDEEFDSLVRAAGSEGVSNKRKHDEVPAANAQLDQDSELPTANTQLDQGSTMSATLYRNNYDAAYPPLDDDSDTPPDRKRQKMLASTDQEQMQPSTPPMSQLPAPQPASQPFGHGRAAQVTASPTARRKTPIKNESDTDEDNEGANGFSQSAEGLAGRAARGMAPIEDGKDSSQGNEDTDGNGREAQETAPPTARNEPFSKDGQDSDRGDEDDDGYIHVPQVTTQSTARNMPVIEAESDTDEGNEEVDGRSQAFDDLGSDWDADMEVSSPSAG